MRSDASARKIQRAILSITIVAFVVCGIFSGVAGFCPLYDVMKTHNEQQIAGAVSSKVLSIQEFINAVKGSALQVSSRTAIRDKLETYYTGELSRHQLSEFTMSKLSDAMLASPIILGISRLDKVGSLFAHVGESIPEQFWIIPADGDSSAHIGTPFLADGMVRLIVGSPIVSRSGIRLGTDLVLVDLSRLRTVVDNLSLSSTLETVFLGTKSITSPLLIFESFSLENSGFLSSVTDPGVREALTRAFLNESGFLEKNQFGTRENVTAYAPIPGTDWGLVIRVSEKGLFSTVWNHFFLTAALIIATVTTAIIGVIIIVRPLTGKLILHAEDLEEEIRSKTDELTSEITYRKQVDQELRANQELLRQTGRIAKVGGWEFNFLTSSLHLTQEASRIYGLPPDHVPHVKELINFLCPDDRPKLKQAIQRAIETGEGYDLELQFLDSSGARKWMRVIGKLDGTVDRLSKLLGVIQDITEQKYAEKRLRESEATFRDKEHKLRAMIQGMKEGIIFIDNAGFITEVNGWFLDKTGLSRDEVLNRPLSSFKNLTVEIEEIIGVLADYNLGATREPRTVTTQLLGTHTSLRVQPLFEDELFKGIILNIIDVTDLVEARLTAEQASRFKAEFLANMSHELRTPLNAIMGFSRLLRSYESLTPEQSEILDIIAQSGRHLLDLINNILDLSKIESGRMGLKETEADLHKLFSEIQSLMTIKAVEKNLYLRVEQSAGFPQFVIVDIVKLRQALLNLVGNAIKFTNRGGVTICGIPGKLESNERMWVRFEVKDTGIGIEEENRGKIFHSFVQLENQNSTDPGTGLGLAISQKNIELMGGKIGVTSDENGSNFYFDIPVTLQNDGLESVQTTRRRAIGTVGGKPLFRVAIVEDNLQNRLLLRKVLEPLGFDLREASNGQEAVELFEEWRPDLIWMDIRMPVMNGMDATRRIRACSGGADVKIIALTAHALEHEKHEILMAGCDDAIQKPFDDRDIFESLVKNLKIQILYDQPAQPYASMLQNSSEAGEAELRNLPPDIINKLLEAAELLDRQLCLNVIGQITSLDGILGEKLERMVNKLQYDELLRTLDKIVGGESK